MCELTRTMCWASWSEIAFAVGEEGGPPIKVADKLRAPRMLYKHLGLGTAQRRRGRHRGRMREEAGGRPMRVRPERKDTGCFLAGAYRDTQRRHDQRGRGQWRRRSGKSSHLSIEACVAAAAPDCHAVVLRKVGAARCATVCANQIVWAIGELGCAGYFRCTVSPMECTCLPTGQKILFFGLDDPGKLKSLKLPFARWGSAGLRSLTSLTALRRCCRADGAARRQLALTLSFNPPAMAPQLGQLLRAGAAPRQAGTPLDLPRPAPRAGGSGSGRDAAHLERTNPAAYRHEYGGQWWASGAAVFDNLQLRTLAQDELDRCDRSTTALTGAGTPDPWAWQCGVLRCGAAHADHL